MSADSANDPEVIVLMHFECSHSHKHCKAETDCTINIADAVFCRLINLAWSGSSYLKFCKEYNMLLVLNKKIIL
jgi:hypothetical protein